MVWQPIPRPWQWLVLPHSANWACYFEVAIPLFPSADRCAKRSEGLIEDELDPNQFVTPYGHFSGFAASEETEVVAVANRSEERLKRFSDRFGVTNTYLDYREMIKREKPGIVSVTTPSCARAEPIIFGAENGVRGIFSEKGLCPSPRDTSSP